jgi:hypothetical protein
VGGGGRKGGLLLSPLNVRDYVLGLQFARVEERQSPAFAVGPRMAAKPARVAQAGVGRAGAMHGAGRPGSGVLQVGGGGREGGPGRRLPRIVMLIAPISGVEAWGAFWFCLFRTSRQA